jgi:hypothetical protein
VVTVTVVVVVALPTVVVVVVVVVGILQLRSVWFQAKARRPSTLGSCLEYRSCGQLLASRCQRALPGAVSSARAPKISARETKSTKDRRCYMHRTRAWPHRSNAQSDSCRSMHCDAPRARGSSDMPCDCESTLVFLHKNRRILMEENTC